MVATKLIMFYELMFLKCFKCLQKKKKKLSLSWDRLQTPRNDTTELLSAM